VQHEAFPQKHTGDAPVRLTPATTINETQDTWRDYAGRRQAFAKPPVGNGCVAALQADVIGPAFALAQELDAARENARALGLSGFELHEAVAGVRPRVHRELVNARTRVDARKAALHAAFAEATKFNPDEAEEAQERYAKIRAKLPESTIAGAFAPAGGGIGRANPAYNHKLANLTVDEACAVLAQPFAADPMMMTAAQQVWLRHKLAESPNHFEAMRSEEEALTWARGVLVGLVALAAPPALAK
jgi:hypothetical protein